MVRAEVEAEARCIRAEEAEAEATHPAPRFSSGPGTMLLGRQAMGQANVAGGGARR